MSPAVTASTAPQLAPAPAAGGQRGAAMPPAAILGAAQLLAPASSRGITQSMAVPPAVVVGAAPQLAPAPAAGQLGAAMRAPEARPGRYGAHGAAPEEATTGRPRTPAADAASGSINVRFSLRAPSWERVGSLATPVPAANAAASLQRP